jgi:hypothetical protein
VLKAFFKLKNRGEEREKEGREKPTRKLIVIVVVVRLSELLLLMLSPLFVVELLRSFRIAPIIGLKKKDQEEGSE